MKRGGMATDRTPPVLHPGTCLLSLIFYGIFGIIARLKIAMPPVPFHPIKARFMKKIRIALPSVLALALVSLSAVASEDAVRERMETLIPGVSPDTVVETPVEGVYEVRYGTQILYMSADGKYVFQGNLVDTETRTNLTESSRTEARKQVVDALDESTMVIYPANGETRHVVTVFTDPDCTFCRRMHAEMAEINEHGITIRYLLFPRTGVDSPSYRKSVSVWCADDQRHAMDEAKLGRDIPPKNCDNPVQEHMALGEQLGVQGTPALVVESGQMLPGYRPVNELAAILEQLAKGR
jgi:thiol:disulfide interchange protein DsbC